MNRMRLTVLIFAALLAPRPALAADAVLTTPHGDYPRSEAMGEMELAEMNLMIVLKEGVRGKPPASETTCEKRLRSAIGLLAIEHRHPGFLRAELSGEWPRAGEVRSLFAKAEKKYKFDYYFRAGLPVKGEAKFLDHGSKARIGGKADSTDMATSVDVAMYSMNVVLGKPGVPSGLKSCEAKVSSAMTLVSVEIRAPKLMDGAYAFPPPARQYEALSSSFKELKKTYQF